VFLYSGFEKKTLYIYLRSRF